MAQKHPCPPNPHISARTTVSANTNTFQAPSVARARRNDTGSATTMDERSDSIPLPEASSLDVDLPIEKAGSDSSNDGGFSSDPVGPGTSDTTILPSDALEEPPRPQRELRGSNALKRIVPSTWIDADDTGDFDPHEENRRARPFRKRTKLSHGKRFNWERETRPIIPGTGNKDEPKPSEPLRLSFRSSSTKAGFQELCATFPEKVTPARDHFNEGYELRKRHVANDGSSLQVTRANATGVRVVADEPPTDYSNHPVARGCLECLALGVSQGMQCSLLDNEHSWPCECCKSLDNESCQLVTEPEFKRACTHCQYLGKKEKWLVCSFEHSQDASDHRGRCAQCQKDGHQFCSAGPRPGVTRTRIRIGSDGMPFTNQAKGLPKTPRISTCRRCLDSHKICSLASRYLRGDTAVCTACDMAGEACELLGPNVPQSQFPRRPKDTLDDAKIVDDKTSMLSSSPEPSIPDELLEDVMLTPDPPASPRDTPSGTVKTMRTKFCHPMHFDYQDVTSDGSTPCHFCSSAHFGMIGLDERKAEVIDWHDGSGWEEIGGGHKADGVKETQMCTNCTMARMQVMICSDHALRRISTPGTVGDLQAAFERILDPEQASGDRWCSVCCNLAAWECCIAQEDQPDEGCGLALCKQCVSDLEDYDGSFETMLQLLEKEPSEARPAGLRADYELLKQEGLLMRYLNWRVGLDDDQ